MTHFERSAIALLCHVFTEILGPTPGKSLTSTSRWVQTLSGAGSVRRFFDIREISWNKVDFKGQTREGDFQVINKNFITPSSADIYTDERGNEKILIEKLGQNETLVNIRGYYSKVYRDGWGIVKIEDNEMSGRTFRYQIKQ